MKEEGLTRSNGFKLDKFKFNKDIGKYWFGNRVVDLWNRLPPAVINSNSIDSFKTWLDSCMGSLGWIYVGSAYHRPSDSQLRPPADTCVLMFLCSYNP